MINRRQFLVWSTITLLTACGNKPTYRKIPSGSTVVALGDSLTFGYGATPDTAYPAILSNKTGWQIINAGVNGDTSEDVLNRLDGIIKQKPNLILLGIGGNDVLRKVDPETTKANINQIVDEIQSANIALVLIAEPYLSSSALFGKASDNPIYAQIAQEKDVPLFGRSDGGWSVILSDNALKSDRIHANAQGYAKFADNLYDYLQDIGFA